jgi:pimeloyl-ACP methyl ester carboxylesterase
MMKKAILAVSAAMALGSAAADELPTTYVRYATVDVDGYRIFYREAGDPARPAILLLHGFPSSSHMYRDLIPRLAQRYHVIAPDMPGSGYSEPLAGKALPQTFDGVSNVVMHFAQQQGLRRFAMYLQDFGRPVGMRLAVAHPEWVSALVIQNANSYDEGLSPQIRDNIIRLRVGVNPQTMPTLEQILSPQGIRFMYETGARHPDRLNPDAWASDEAGLRKDANRRMQMNLLVDYHTNVEQYPVWQAYLRKHQPPTLVVWGKNDPLFTEAGANPYARDLKRVETHLLDTGHFALEEAAPEIAAHVLAFLDRQEAAALAGVR